MPRPKIKTVRASTHPLGTGDFTTIQAWEDFADSKTNPHQWAECYAGFNLGLFNLSGWSSTPTSSGYPRIFASSGEPIAGASFNDGPVIAMPSGTTSVNTIGVSYSQIDGLGSTRGFHINLETASNVTIENCWATSQDSVCFKAKSSTNATSSSGIMIRNCLAIGTNTHDVGFEIGGEEMMYGKPEIKVLNCTAYGHKNSGFKVFNTKAPGFYGGGDVTLKNCLSMDATGSDFTYSLGGNGSLSISHNMSSDFSAAEQGNNNYYNQSSALIFENPDKALFVYSPASGVSKVAASGNFRLREFGSAVNAGTTLSEITRDIRGVKRPYYSNMDIGAYEFGLFNKRFALFISGPVPVSSGIFLHMRADKEQPASGYVPFFAQSLGFITPSSGINLFAQSLGPGTPSSGVNLFAQSLGFNRVQSSGNSPQGSGQPSLFAQSQGFITVSSGVRLFAKSEGFVKASGQPTLYAQSTGFTTVSSGIRMFAQSQGFVTSSGLPTLYLPASGYATVSSGVRLFAKAEGNVDSSGYVSLALLGFYEKQKSSFSVAGHGVKESGVKLWIGAAVPHSGLVTLNIGNFTFKRKSPLFLKVKEDTSTVGVSSFTSALSDPSTTTTASLSIDARLNTSNSDYSVQRMGASGNQELFKQDPDLSIGVGEDGQQLSGPGISNLNIAGFSNIRGPDSQGVFRNRDVDSSNYFPFQRSALMFSASEVNCCQGSFYKFDNNTNDNSPDYNFKLYASGFYAGGAGYGDVTPMLESGFYQTSTRFPSSSLTGSGVARFIGGTATSPGIKMIENASYYGTVLMQSGSPSQSDQHRIHADRRGVSASFWINKKKGRKQLTGLASIQGVMGNLEISLFPSHAASGEWGIYYVPTAASASGNTPFNSLKSLIQVEGGLPRVDTAAGVLGGIMPFVSTTAGGRMGRLLKTDGDELVEPTVPDTMIPLGEDRWYYMKFWVDTQLKKSFIRIASPAKGTPGQSGYMEEIKPITDKCQQWDGYEVNTDTEDLKFKVGGNLYRNTGTLPYYNLGYNIGGVEKTQEEFLIDEVTISNRICSIKAMEDKFDSDYNGYTRQFIEGVNPPLFITGDSGVLL